MKDESFGPLTGVRVLDLGTNIAGPFGPTLLAEFGAEVIKIEAPKVGDPFRSMSPLYKGKSLTWIVLARNKRSITLDLRKTKGQEILKKLVKVSDMVVENFRPGTMEKWGLGYEELKKINPRIIMVRVSGFGHSGPYKDLAGYDRIASAMGGMTYITGYPDAPPVRVGVNLMDHIAGLFNVFGALIALYHRDVHAQSEGQWIDVSLCESVTRLLEAVIAEYHKLGTIRERVGNSNVIVAPAENFLTKDGKWLVFVVTSDTLFNRFLNAIGREDLMKDLRFKSNIDRVKNRDALHSIIAAWFKEKDVSEIKEVFQKKGIPVGLVYNAKDILEDPHNKARENIIEINDPEIGPVKMQNVTPRLSVTPGKVVKGAPSLGEHNDEIYGKFLGFTKADLEILREEEII